MKKNAANHRNAALFANRQHLSDTHWLYGMLELDM